MTSPKTGDQLLFAMTVHTTETLDEFFSQQDLVNYQNKNGNTPLIIATKQGKPAYIERLLQMGADPNLANLQGHTPLHYLVTSADQSKSLNMLIKAGANLEALSHLGETPFALLTRMNVERDPYSGLHLHKVLLFMAQLGSNVFAPTSRGIIAATLIENSPQSFGPELLAHIKAAQTKIALKSSLSSHVGAQPRSFKL